MRKFYQFIRRWQGRLSTLLVWKLLTVIPLSAQAQTPFSCSSLAYQVAQAPSTTTSTLYSFNVANGQRTQIATLPYVMNGIGYDVQSNFLWGSIYGATGQIGRIDATGAVTAFTIPNLPTTGFNVGDVLQGGYLFLYSTSTANYYVVDINPARPTTYLKLVDPTTGYTIDNAPYGTAIAPAISVADFAYSPATGLLYSVTSPVDANPFRVVTLNPTTGVTTLSSGAATGDGIQGETQGFGASFIDNSGNLFVFANALGKFFKVNIDSQVATLISNSTPNSQNDGASCTRASLLPPTPFACSSKVYQVAVPAGRTTSTLYEFDINTGSRTTLATLTRNINAIGYNTTDNFIWGFDSNANQVVRIDANGSTLTYTIPNLPNLTYAVGDVMNGGYLFLYPASGTRYYVVDINPSRTATYLQLVDPVTSFTIDNAPFGTATTARNISDWTYDPATGNFYGLTNPTDANPFQIVTLNPTTGVSTLSGTQVVGNGIRQETSAFGATYIDNTGTLYVYANTLDVFYKINRTTFAATQLSVTGMPLTANDGASCPLTNLITNPAPFSCNSTAYQVAIPTGSGLTTSVLYGFDINSGTRTALYTLDRNINAIGYNTADNLIWGYDNNAKRVVRVDANGVTTAFSILNLPTTQNYVVGDVLNTGYLFLLGATDNRYYVIDLVPTRSRYLDMVEPLNRTISDASPYGQLITARSISDWAYSQANDRFYGLTNPSDSNPFQVVVLNPATGSTTLVSGLATGGGIRGESSSFGATFVDNNAANLYVYANTLDEFFKIDLNSKVAVKLSSADLPLSDNDGASCNLSSLIVAPTSFSCTSTAYQVAIPNGETNSTLYGFNVTTGARTTVGPLNRAVNAIGYNLADNLIWGYDNTAHRVVRIDATGKVTAFNITNLTTNVSFGVGDVINGGYLFLYGGGRYYVVDITPSRTATYLSLVEPLANTIIDATPFGQAITVNSVTDWAYNPATNRFYALTNPGTNAYRLVTLDPTTGSTTLSTGTVFGGGIQSETSAFGSAFVDATGSFFVYANTLDRFFQINLATNTATALGTTGIPLTGNDGASCTTAQLNNPPMPVSLISFSAQAQVDQTVLLQWKTSLEKANKLFIVERSKDLLTFDYVGQVSDVAGTSNSISSYQLVDNNPYRGTSYYRLTQVDLDGTQRSYPAISVLLDARYGVSPNPVAAKSFTLELDEPVSAIVQLHDLTGRTVSLEKSNLTQTSVTLSAVQQLVPGVYVLTVAERGTLRQYRLVIQ